MNLQEIASFLRSLADNDYMINSSYLPDGETLIHIAATLEALQCTATRS